MRCKSKKKKNKQTNSLFFLQKTNFNIFLARTNLSDPKKSGTKRRVPPPLADLTDIIMSITKRKPRAAAQKAVLGIGKSLEDTIYEFKSYDTTNLSTKTSRKPNANSKTPSPVPKSPSLGSMKKGAAKTRKLWSRVDNQIQLKSDDESNSSPIKRPPKNNTDVELTPRGFRKSVYKNPSLQKSHMLENASRINEDVKRKASELKRATNSTKPSDSTCNPAKVNVRLCVCFMIFIKSFWIGY